MKINELLIRSDFRSAPSPIDLFTESGAAPEPGEHHRRARLTFVRCSFTLYKLEHPLWHQNPFRLQFPPVKINQKNQCLVFGREMSLRGESAQCSALRLEQVEEAETESEKKKKKKKREVGTAIGHLAA